MKLALAPRRRGSGDSILPLINIVFLLMVFFMLVGSLAPSEALDIQPARSRQLSLADAGDQSLLIAADGRLGLGRQVFVPEQLAAQAATWLAHHPGQALDVKADAALEAQSVIAILEALQAAGIGHVNLLAADPR